MENSDISELMELIENYYEREITKGTPSAQLLASRPAAAGAGRPARRARHRVAGAAVTRHAWSLAVLLAVGCGGSTDADPTGGLVDPAGTPAACDPAALGGLWLITAGEREGCETWPVSFTHYLDWPMSADRECPELNREVTPSGCTLRTEVQCPDAKHVLTVSQLEGGGASGRYEYSAAAESCWWTFTAAPSEE